MAKPTATITIISKNPSREMRAVRIASGTMPILFRATTPRKKAINHGMGNLGRFASSFVSSLLLSLEGFEAVERIPKVSMVGIKNMTRESLDKVANSPLIMSR